MTKHEWPMHSPRRPVPWGSSSGFPLDFVIRICSFVWQIRRDGCCDEDVHERDLKKEQPAEPHQLIVTKTRQRPAYPHKHENQRCDFDKKRCDVEQTPDHAAPTGCASIDKHPVESSIQ